MKSYVLIAVVLAAAAPASAQAPVPYKWGEIKASTAAGFAGKKIIVPWNEPEGRARLHRSKHNADFYQLAHAYQPQINPVYATVASAVVILNAMRQPAGTVPSDPANELTKPAALGGGVLPFPAYSQATFLNDRTDAIKNRKLILLKEGAKPGLGLEDLGAMLSSVYQASAEVTIARFEVAAGTPAFRKILKGVLRDSDSFIIANFDGRVLGANTEGTVSPLAAYDEKTDSVLILDVTGHKNPWYWVPVEALYAAMHTRYDDKTRGWMLIRDAR